MKKSTRLPTLAVSLTAIGAALAVFSNSVQAQVTFQSVSNGLVSFYPLDSVITNGAILTTPDHIGGRDLILSPFTTGANLVPANRPLGAPGASSNCFNLNQSGGPTVLYYNSRGQSPLEMTNPAVSDFLPFCNQLDATMSFWIKGAAVGTDTRFMGEAANDGNNDPLWLWGDHSSGPGKAHLIFRHTVNNGGFTTMSDGTRQNPLAGNYMNQDSAYTTNAILDNTWHLFTVVIDTNGFVDVYVDGNRDPGIQNGAGGYTNALGEFTVCKPMFVTNTYYTTNLYPKVSPPASNPPPSGYVKWVMNSMFTGGSTAFGGFKRGGVSAGINCQIDDIAFWNRALTSDEIAFVYTNGLPGIPLTRPLIINNFAASIVEVAKGDVATLAWNVTGASTTPGSITISGVGDVTAIGAIGSVDVPVNGDQLFTLTATNATGTAGKSINVKVFPGVDSNWHLFQRFDGVYADTDNGIATDIYGNRDWNSAISSYAGAFDRWNVVTLTNSGATNKVLSPRTGYVPNTTSAIGFDSRGALAYANLNSLTVGPNQTRTLFFRFSLHDPESWVQDFGVYSDMDAHIGLTDYNWWAGPEGAGPAPAELFSKGPMVNIVRATTTGDYSQQEPFDLRAYDWSGTGTTNTYSYLASVNAAGLQTNVNYMLWMDIENHNTGYDTNTSSTTNMPLYSVYLQKQGDPTRTLLFSGFHGNRNYAPPTDLGPNQATPYLDKFFANMGTESILTSVPGAYFETNMIAIDDIYLSKSGVNSTVPRLFDITSIVKGTSSVTLTWGSLGSLFGTNTYTIQRKTALTDATWSTLATIPSGGATTTYVDNTIGSSSSAYYRVVWP